jgi:hypothetical protein
MDSGKLLSIPILSNAKLTTMMPQTPFPHISRDGRRRTQQVVFDGQKPYGARGGSRTRTTFRSGDFKSPAATNYATRAAITGGGGRNRTGVHGFAGRCMTTLPPRQIRKKGKRLTYRRPFSPGIWSGKRGSNSRPQPWQGCALPTELFPHSKGACNSASSVLLYRGIRLLARRPLFAPGKGKCRL